MKGRPVYQALRANEMLVYALLRIAIWVLAALFLSVQNTNIPSSKVAFWVVPYGLYSVFQLIYTLRQGYRDFLLWRILSIFLDYAIFLPYYLFTEAVYFSSLTILSLWHSSLFGFRPGLLSAALASIMLALFSAHSINIYEHEPAGWLFPILLLFLGAICVGQMVESRKKLQVKLHLQSKTDGLTGLYNRRNLMEYLSAELRRAKTIGTPVALLMMDLDFFKEYNDRYGHLEGDKLLQKLADLLRQNLRNFDCVARYGGDEFAVVLPNVSGKEARAIKERLNEAIEEIEVTGTEKGGKISASIGMAEFPLEASNLEELIQKADNDLYRAKAYRKFGHHIRNSMLS